MIECILEVKESRSWLEISFMLNGGVRFGDVIAGYFPFDERR